jgi:tetratricopeptide (TPR) repeat protein
MRAELLGLLLSALPALGGAQSFAINIPLKSQKAEVSQTIGLTDITIAYHRPLVNGRVIWDSLVPYGKVWRSGANINTTISFSDPVTVNGQPLGAGTYGLHTIPGRDQWTIIFSKNSTSWGSFTYNQAEDALRITVQPQSGAMHNALTYEFDDLEPGSATVELLWEKVVVPFSIAVDVHAVMLASLRRQLRTLQRYGWMGWNDAASYLLDEKFALDTALADADTSISNEDRFENEMTKAKILTALNRPADAGVAQNRALDLGTPLQVDAYARTLLTQKKDSEAFAIFRRNGTKHPDQWFVHDGMARVYSAAGKFGDAEKEIKVALASAPEKEKSRLQELLKQLDAKKDINQSS